MSQSPVVYLIHLLRKARHFTAARHFMCHWRIDTKKRKDSFFAFFFHNNSNSCHLKDFFFLLCENPTPHVEDTIVTPLLIRGYCQYAMTK